MAGVINRVLNIYGKYPISCIYKKVVKDNDSALTALISSAFSEHDFDENYSLKEWRADLASKGLIVNTEVIEFRQYYVKSAWGMLKRIQNGENSSSIKEG